MRKHGILALLALMAMAFGCAQERPPINRVQANALAKSFFVGENLQDISDDPEFWFRTSVVDVGYGAAQDGLFTSSWAEGQLSRIKWEITETHLNGRLAYERIADTDGKGNAIDGFSNTPKTTNDGQVVASFPIISHFDIKRAYNPTTGEPLNVIEENSTDRPWYEREYFRVDWGTNQATDAYDFDTLSLIGIYGGIDYEPLSFYVADPNDSNAPHFDMEQGYFDVTTKAFAKPKDIDLSALGWGIDKFPACMLPGEFAGGTQPYGNCNPVELTLRHSFRKVIDTDYEPDVSDGLRFQAFGGWDMGAVRMGYERNVGMVDDKWYRFFWRYNLYDRSHYYADPATMTGEIKCATHDTTVVPTGDPNADPNRDLDKNGTADECEAVTAATGIAGSQCDIYKSKCTMPYVGRTTKTTPWYVTGELDEDLFEASMWAVQEWNIALKTAVQTSKLVECRKTGYGCDDLFPMWHGQMDDYQDAIDIAREQEACQRKNGWDATQCSDLVDQMTNDLANERGANGGSEAKAIDAVVKMPHLLVLCHNPVIEGDHPACGPVGLSPRMGDLRYHIVNHIATPQTPSAWGIVTNAADPLTGENIAGCVNIWTHITDIYAQNAVDLIRYINGELKTSDITNGTYIHNWVQAQKVSAGGMATPTFTKDQIHTRLAAVTTLEPKAFDQIEATALSPELKAVLKQGKAIADDAAESADVPSASQADVAARMAAVRGTPTEAALINAPMLQLAGITGDMPISGPIASYASPMALNNPKLRAEIQRLKQMGLAKRGACVIMEDEAPEPSGVPGLAAVMLKKFPIASGETGEQRLARWEAMWRFLRRRFHYAVIGHEMGHSVSLRHNFISSAGPLHYRPQYWQLRTKNGSVTTECTGPVTDGSTCVGPRWYDPVTADETNQMMFMFQQSSIMDYAGDISVDLVGAGIYDFATLRNVYGNTIAYYTSPDIQDSTALGEGITAVTDDFGGLAGLQYEVGGNPIHYSQLQNNYKLIDHCYSVTPKTPQWWDESKDGPWDPLLDGYVVQVDGQYTKCRQMPVDYAAYKDLTGQPVIGENTGYVRARAGNIINMPDGSNRLRVPYHFATDHWADTGNVSVFRHDQGADVYEQIQWLINTQENRHIFDNFRRDRTTFDIRAAADRSFSRYNEKLANMAGGLAFMARLYQFWGPNSGYTFDSLWPYIVSLYYSTNMIAASVAFDHLARQLARPENGDHYFLPSAFQDAVARSMNDADGSTYNVTSAFTIPNGTSGFFQDVSLGGHPIENALDESKGDYAVEYELNAGSYYDKVNSIIHLSMSEDRFISQSRGDFYDARFRANGLPDLFTDGYRRIVANSLTNDRSILAPHLWGTQSGSTCKPVLDATCDTDREPGCDKYPGKTIGWTSWWPKDGPSMCFASEGRQVCNSFTGSENFDPDSPPCTIPVDPEVGWEVQKFVIAWVLTYIPANWQSQWIDMMKIYRLGPEVQPAFENRIEWMDPQSGDVYYARTYGKECFFGSDAACTGGKMVQKGIAARVLEYANELSGKGYALDTTTCPATANFPAGYTQYGRPCLLRQPSGNPIIKSDPAICALGMGGSQCWTPADCDQNVDPNCVPLTVGDNHYAYMLNQYKSVPDYLWEAVVRFGFGDPHELGFYP